MAPIGARVNSLGWIEWVAWPIIFARGSRPFSASPLASTNADAPSEIEDALAAVIVPSAF